MPESTLIALSYEESPLITYHPLYFNEIAKEIEKKYTSFEENMIETFEYVNLEYSNQRTHSNVFKNIFLGVGDMFNNIIDKSCIKFGYRFGYNNYLKFSILENIDPKLTNRTVTMKTNDKIILPFLTNFRDIPFWWTDYLELNSEKSNDKLGHLENAITSLASLAIFYSMLTKKENSNLFKKIGQIHDVEKNMLLFP